MERKGEVKAGRIAGGSRDASLTDVLNGGENMAEQDGSDELWSTFVESMIDALAICERCRARSTQLVRSARGEQRFRGRLVELEVSLRDLQVALRRAGRAAFEASRADPAKGAH